MCQASSLNIISKSTYGYIGYCKGCDRYNLCFENIFILLSEEEIKGLGNIVDVEYGTFLMETPVGRGKTISFQTPLSNTYFAFTACEYEEFKRMINESVLMLQVNEIINQKQ